MTKEALKKEAEEWLDNERKYLIEDNEGNLINISKKVKEAYFAGAEPREKRIEELEDKLAKKVTLESLKIVSAREKELEEKNRELSDRLCNVANSLLDNWCRNEEDYCPHLVKLEKENALLKGRNEGFEIQIMGLLIKYAEVYKRFPDLKSAMDKAKEVLKENAELKEQLRLAKEMPYTAVKKFAEERTQDQLIKAKEIIRELLNNCFGYNSKTVNYKVKAKAEQFLSEVEK